jgi:uncharacterized metal-binding protein YceD (DUF177 family)
MHLDVGALRRQGVARHRLDVSLSPTWLARTLSDTDAEVTESGGVTLDVTLPAEGAVVARGQIRVRFVVPCGRCLDPAQVDHVQDILATFTRAGSLLGDIAAQGAAQSASDEPDDDDPGRRLSEADLDLWAYDGSSIDFALVIAEHVKLAYPMRALCHRGEDCRGLCSNCGLPLNDLPQTPRCPACDSPLLGPIATPEAAEAPIEGPLAAALKKLDLPD